MLDLDVVVRDLKKEVIGLENAIGSGESVSLPLLNIKYTVDFHLEDLGVLKKPEEDDSEGDDPFTYVTISGKKRAFVDTTSKLVWYDYSEVGFKWIQVNYSAFINANPIKLDM